MAGGNGGLNSSEIYNPTGGTWDTTSSSLSTARAHHTATRLNPGQVLVAGGFNGVPLNSSELYTPAVGGGTWTTTSGSLVTGGRAEHTATLLNSGQVLVAGGYDADNTIVLNTAELYNPTDGTWSSTQSLSTRRTQHSSTRLPNGKVLVAAGLNATSPKGLASAELYDQTKGTWSTTASLIAKRYAHTATLLNTGQVLVAGGAYDTAPLSSAELYHRPAISPIIYLLLLH